MTEKRWSFNGGVIVGTDICEEGIPHTNRSIVTHLNRYERKIRELEEENEQLKKDLKKQFVPFARADENRITKVDTDIFINILQENEQLNQKINEIKESIEYLKNKEDVTLADVDGTLNTIDKIINGDVE